jgi:N-dimethylarginine dimethylaminohydrolase
VLGSVPPSDLTNALMRLKKNAAPTIISSPRERSAGGEGDFVWGTEEETFGGRSARSGNLRRPARV